MIFCVCINYTLHLVKSLRYQSKTRKHFESALLFGLGKFVYLEKELGEMAAFTPSQKGKNLLVVGGYSYTRDGGSSIGRSYWKCCRYSSDGCRGRAKTYDGVLSDTTGEHNHVPDVCQIEAKKVVNDVKRRATECMEHPQKVIADIIKELPKEVNGALPSMSALVKNVQRSRRAAHYPTALPKSLEELDIPPMYQSNSRGEKFLQCDSGQSQNRVILFATGESLAALRACRMVFSDGTFKTCPTLFTQIYTLHGDLDGRVVPLVYGLLARKDYTMYKTFLEQLKGLLPGWAPAIVTTDFEEASIKAWREAFPNARQHGCFFHYGQCLWRKIQTLPDILHRYTNDAEFCGQVKCLGALAFVPSQDVTRVYEELTASQFYRDNVELHDLLPYYERTWVGAMNFSTGQRGQPLFPVDLWNCRELTLEKLHVTNNAMEGWDRQFSVRVGGNHPSIWPLIKAFMSEEVLASVKIREFIGGAAPPRKRCKYAQKADCVYRSVQLYDRLPPLKYLEGIAYNVEFNV